MTVFISHRHSDTTQALSISSYLKEHGIRTYLDVLDPESQTTDNITAVITKNIASCTHLIAVMSHDTAKSWWVPFEIGEATITNRRIASYRIGYSQLPEYLEHWPQMHSMKHLDLFISAYKQEKQVSTERKMFESLGTVQTDKSGADTFHRNLKNNIRFS